MQWFHDNFGLMFALCIAWVLLLIAGTCIYFWITNRPILSTRPSDAIYSEHWLSARYHGSFLHHFLGANQCLYLHVTPTGLQTGFEFPFNLIPLWIIFGYVHNLPYANIQSATIDRSTFGRERLRITFTQGTNRLDREGRRITLIVYPRDVHAVLAHVRPFLTPGKP